MDMFLILIKERGLMIKKATNQSGRRSCFGIKRNFNLMDYGSRTYWGSRVCPHFSI